MPFDRLCSTSRPLRNHLRWPTFQLLTSLQPTNQLCSASSTSSFRCTRPESVEARYHHDSTSSVDLFAVRLADSKEYIGGPGYLLIGWPGYSLCEECTAVTRKRNGRSGRRRSPPTPRTPSVYGPPLTLFLAGIVQTTSLTKRLSRLTTF